MRGDRRIPLLLFCVLVLAVVVGVGVAFARSSAQPSHHKPAHRKLPAITGSTQVGLVLHASRGRWIQASRFAYSWELCNARGKRCKPIASATKRPKHKPLAYLIPAKDLGHTMRITVVASNASGKTSATSRATAVIRRAGQTTTEGGPNQPPGGTSSPPVGTSAPPATPGSLGTGQTLAFWLAWTDSVQEADVPWDAVTEISLFSVGTCTTTETKDNCDDNPANLDTVANSINRMNVPAWTGEIHAHGKLALVSFGGAGTDWDDACSSTYIAAFTTNLVNFMVSNGFDGVDIDIEDSPSNWAQCLQYIYNAVHAVKTQAGKVPIVSTDVDESWMDPDVATFYQYADQFNLMYYGFNPVGDFNCGAGTPYGTCAVVAGLVTRLHTVGHVPYNKMLLGFSPGGGQAQCCYVNLATTSAAITSGQPITSIPVSSIATAIPAGNVVLATTQNPPTTYQVLTTPGAAVCSSNCSIPITGSPSWGTGTTAKATYASGDDVQNAYLGPWDCGNMARYASANGLEGVMVWDLQEEAGRHNGEFPCFDQIAPYVAQAP